MLKRKITSALAWIVTASLSLSFLPSYMVFAAEESEDTSVETSITIDGETTDPATEIMSAINAAEEDITIYLTEEPADGENEVVYSFEEPLTVPEDISITIIGADDTEYIFQADNSEACSDSATETVYTGFVNIYGSLSLTNVTIDANEQGRAVYVSGGTLVMESNAVVENGYLISTNSYNYMGAGILAHSDATLIMKNDCYVRYNTMVISEYHAYGAGICKMGTGTVYLYEGSHVSYNVIEGTSETTSYSACGAGIYGMASRLYMEGCYIENNSITNMYGNAAGAGIYSNSGEPETAWKDITVSGNMIEHMGSEKYAYGAGMYCAGSTSACVKMQGGIVTGNSITGYASYAYGAGIYTSSTGAKAEYRPVFEDVSITDNVIDCEVTNAAYGAGLYSAVIYMGGDMQITGNTLNGEDSNFYSRSTNSRYAAYLTSALGEEASVGFRSAQATSTGTYAAIEGDADSDYTMTQSDFSKLYYEDSEYDLIYEDGTAKVAGREPTGTGGTFHVSTSEELISYLENASNRATGTDGADSTGGTTNIILDNDIVLEEQPLLNSGRYATITSNGDDIYSITAGSSLSGTEMDTMFFVGGTLELTNVTLDAQQKGRVVETLSGADLTIGEGATVTGGYALSGTVTGVGILNAENAMLTIAEGGTVTYNTVNDSSVTDVDGNVLTATKASGLGIYNKGTLLVEGGTITNNIDYKQQTNVGTYTGTEGGAVYVTSAGTVNITGGTISGNVVGTNGGAFYVAGTITVSGDTTISENVALSEAEISGVYQGGTGGAFYIVGGTVTLTGDAVVIEDNESMWGGAIYMSSSTTRYPTLNIYGAVIRNNTAHISKSYAGAGGGIYMSNGATVNMTSGEISGNQVVLDDVADTTSSTLLSSLELNGRGGGIYVAGAGAANSMVSVAEGVPVLNLTGGTITGNYAYAGGSGIYVANYSGGSATSSINTSYKFYGSGILNVSGSPVVSGNEDDDILLAAARYIDDDADWQQRTDLDDNQHDDVHDYSEYRTNIIYPVYLHIVGELEDGADLHVSKEFLTYDAETLWSEERTYDWQFDGVIVKGSSDYAITEENLDSVLSAVDIDILTDGFWQLVAATVEESGTDDTDGGTLTLTAVEGISLTVTTAVADSEDLSYTGSALTPAVVVTAASDGAETVLAEGTDYTVEYADNTAVGTASYTVTGTGRYRGTVTGEFTVGTKSIEDADVDISLETMVCVVGADAEEVQAQEPAVTVSANGTALTQDVDYTVIYADNTAVGTATVTVTGMGNYTGTVTKTFVICGSDAEYVTADGLLYAIDDGQASLYTGVYENLYYKDGTLHTGVVTIDGVTYSVKSGVMTVLCDSLAVRRGATFYISYELESGVTDLKFTFGKSTDEVLVGDWNGDGVDTVCLRRGNRYYFTNTLGGDVDFTIEFGESTDEALVGDWDGDGVDTLCLRRGNTYYFYNDLNSTKASSVLTYGKSSDEVLVGDWNNDGVDTLCVRRGNVYYFSNDLENTAAEITLRYGKSTDEVLVGDWNDDGVDTLCIRRGNKYYFSNDLESETAASKLNYGKSTDEVYVGRWQ